MSIKSKKLTRQKRQQKLVKKASLWTKTAYIATNDINAVAIYRAIAIILFSLLAYDGSQLVSGEKTARSDIDHVMGELDTLRVEVAYVKGGLAMSDHRADRMIERVNQDEKDLAALKVRMDFALSRSK